MSVHKMADDPNSISSQTRALFLRKLLAASYVQRYKGTVPSEGAELVAQKSIFHFTRRCITELRKTTRSMQMKHSSNYSSNIYFKCYFIL